MLDANMFVTICLCVLLLWTKIASAMEGLKDQSLNCLCDQSDLEPDPGLDANSGSRIPGSRPVKIPLTTLGQLIRPQLVL